MPAHLARRLLASAALLLAATLAACDTPTHPADVTVFGGWEGVSAPYPVVLADGSHNVSMHARFTFDAAGVYSELQFLVDADHNTVLGYTQASTGHYSARGGRMVLLHEQELVRDPHSPFAATPTLAPVTPHQARLTYEVNGSVMLLGADCPSNADCIPPFPPLQRTFELD